MYTRMQLTRVNVGLRPEVFEQLGERAVREGRSVGAMAARLIERGLGPDEEGTVRPSQMPPGAPHGARVKPLEAEQASDEPVLVTDPEFAQ